MSDDKQVEHLQKAVTNLQKQLQLANTRMRASQEAMGEIMAANIELRSKLLLADNQIAMLTNQLQAASAKEASQPAPEGKKAKNGK